MPGTRRERWLPEGSLVYSTRLTRCGRPAVFNEHFTIWTYAPRIPRTVSSHSAYAVKLENVCFVFYTHMCMAFFFFFSTRAFLKETVEVRLNGKTLDSFIASCSTLKLERENM